MSRALDPAVQQALQVGDHRGVYDKVASVFSQRHEALLDIEVLGSSHVTEPSNPVLLDGNAVAVTKIALVQSFVVARRIFLAARKQSAQVYDEGTLKATAVLLLMDPEHLTAANTRKRMLLDHLQQQEGDDSAIADKLQSEKYFTDSLLTSRLHRHTKSPTLWSHRRWLMGQYQRCHVAVDVHDDLQRVICISGERHPRNYYAWLHARELVQQSPRSQIGLLQTTYKWCLAHHDDISGWMYLLFLCETTCANAQLLMADTLRLTRSFQWKNESLWVFLSLFAARDFGRPWREQVVVLANDLIDSDPKGTEQETLVRAIRHIRLHDGLTSSRAVAL